MALKTLVISGGSSGIGASIVKRFLENGYQVFNLDICESELKSNAHFVHCDITDHCAVQKCIANITSNASIDTVISNAGIHLSANIEDTSEQTLLKVFDINVKGAFSLTQACLPHMKKHGGCILYVASEQALIGKTNSFAYNLSKHSLASMAKTTALDYAAFNIRANAICPGTIETPLYHNAIDKYCAESGEDKANVHQQEGALQPLGRIGQPEEVASLALFLASDEASFITGSLQVIDGGYTAK